MLPFVLFIASAETTCWSTSAMISKLLPFLITYSKTDCIFLTLGICDSTIKSLENYLNGKDWNNFTDDQNGTMAYKITNKFIPKTNSKNIYLINTSFNIIKISLRPQ